jgi:Ca2+/Na+ antiporter
MIPAVMASAYVRMCTKVTQPPATLIFIYAILGFIMSIQWVSFTSNIVVDLITVLGVMLDLPKTLLGLTLLAWGNCLGDMKANIAMTKKGFGEMAITGCIAGPIFNVLIGLGLSTLGPLFREPESSIHFSLFDEGDEGKLNRDATLAAVLIVGEIACLTLIWLNAFRNEYHIASPIALANCIFYSTVIAFLVVFTFV